MPHLGILGKVCHDLRADPAGVCILQGLRRVPMELQEQGQELAVSPIERAEPAGPNLG